MIYKTEMIEVDGAVGFTAATIAAAKAARKKQGLNGVIKRVVCSVETASIRFRCDGVAPTSSVGHLMGVGDTFSIDAEDVGRFKAIKVSATGNIAASYEV
jgi:hypothetical protein